MDELILIDTSVWIDFFNSKNSNQVEQLQYLLIHDKPICLCPTILQEVLQGFEFASKRYEIVKDDLMNQRILVCEPVMAAIKAAELYQECRKKGVTIRKSNDCLIAYHAIHFNAKILHCDKDFDLISHHTSLKIL